MYITALKLMRNSNPVLQHRFQWFDYAFIPKNLEWLDLHDNHIEELQVTILRISILAKVWAKVWPKFGQSFGYFSTFRLFGDCFLSKNRAPIFPWKKLYIILTENVLGYTLAYFFPNSYLRSPHTWHFYL
jgi:Leucine-rich repeat (LRR) protein